MSPFKAGASPARQRRVEVCHTRACRRKRRLSARLHPPDLPDRRRAGLHRFTIEHSDEAAARLAGRFALLAKQVVAARDGRVLELRGDEALVVFASARPALHAALDLQERFTQEMEADPSLPLRVVMGLDAGDAIPLHLSREHEHAVSPLSVPDPKLLPDPQSLSQYEAVALFIERAKAAKDSFVL